MDGGLKRRFRAIDESLVVEHPWWRPTFRCVEGDEVPNIFQVRARIASIGARSTGGATPRCPAVGDQIAEIVGGQAEVDWHQHRADLRHRVEGLELRVRVGCDISDAIALLDTETL